ncbi:hypothetical protein ACFFWC_30880 [Plantactinospora siamensis]|uniref:LppX_LprAFG lipoprotein n=1 Tax=Plantactinospora siamensis TaxID=555372 RepID=A0ABV6NUA1_9ACTN
MDTRLIGRNVVVLAAGAALLAGCGGTNGAGAGTSAPPASASTAPEPSASPTPSDNGVAALAPAAIVDRAKAALKNAKSFRMSGTTKEDGQKFTLDFKISGANLVGDMTIGKGKVQLLRVGKKGYMKPDAAFWRMSAGTHANAIVELVGDRWVLVPAGDKDFASMFGAADVNELLKPDGKVTKGQPKDINGTPAIGLVDHAKSGGTLYVATVGEPYPVRIQGKTAADGGINFSDFGATFSEIKPPAAADVVDLSKIH